MTAMRNDLLMKDGPWELRAHNSRTYLLNSYIKHICPGFETNRYWYSLALIDGICEGCQEYPPEDMMGLWKLHNMDYIQAGNTH